MKASPQLSHFPARINLRLSLALSVIVATVLLVGGISLVLAVRISRMNEAVDQQNAHIRVTDQIHTTFQRIIVELHQMHAIGWFDRKEDVQALGGELTHHLETFRALHHGEENFPEEQQEMALFADLGKLAGDLRALTDRMLATPGRNWHLGPMDLAQLNIVSHQVMRKAEDLNTIHRAKVARLLQASGGMLQRIVGLYLAFLLLGGAVVALASLAFTRRIAAPLRGLADAALEIAEGHLDKRVAVHSLNEIGQLSHSFNVMADRLQSRERDLRTAHAELEQKVRETQALYRIGTEISGLHELDRILRSVVENARELLHSEAAALCMFTPEQNELVALATSGPPEAFRSGESKATRNRPAGRTAATPGELDGHLPRCTVMQPEFLRAHLAAPLRRGERAIGVICVCGREPRTFTTAETELLTGLATQAAIAIENSRLYEEVRSLATLEERGRIAREMHDGLTPVLGLLYMKLRQVQEPPAAGDAFQIADTLREMTAITEHAYEEVRQSIFGLRTMVSRGLGLVPTLTEYLHEFSAQTGIAVKLEVADGGPIRLSPASEVQLVRIIQEALTNVWKHAEAGRAWVRLDRQEPWVRVTIQDDGRGFDPTTPASSERRHFGLQTMRERAEGLGGKLDVDAAAGRGTRIVATLPGEA
ncbi:MAG: HAMP domain-containing protein [candidate division NC10 bacterium]|nr:HAMP domain-containing protein [candidate division NC10 bacterium]